MKRTAPFLVLICLLLISCTASIETVRKAYEEAPSCCKKFSEFRYEKIEIGKGRNFYLKASTPAARFSTGKSFFKAFELPDFSRPYRITVRSYFVGDRPEKSYIFFPVVIFLDKKFEVTREVREDAFENMESFFGFRRGLFAEIPVKEENAEDKYMIILTTEDLLKETTLLKVPNTIPLFLPGLAGAIPIGWRYIEVPNAPLGRLKVELRPLGRKK